jgi:hypothetical protein
MGNLPYEERLRMHGLTTSKARRDRGDIINTYKILTGKVDAQQGGGKQHKHNYWTSKLYQKRC